MKLEMKSEGNLNVEAPMVEKHFYSNFLIRVLDFFRISTFGFRIFFSFILLPSSFILLFSGCSGPYGGASLVPDEYVRTIEPMDLSRAATTQASTMPTTQSSTTEPAATVTLSLEEVRQMALQNNLDIKVELVNPTISKTAINQAEAQFEPLFNSSANYSVNNDPVSTELNGSNVKDLNIQSGLVLPLQTGGTIQLNVPMDRLETDNKFSTLNPAYSSDVSASFSQPLLRGAGVATNTHQIRIAYYDYQISQAETKLAVIRVLADAERAYWRLYAAREVLIVNQKEYDLAVAQLERARRQVQFGAAAEVEIVRAESGVSDNVGAIITAENAVRDRQRELKRIINQDGLGMETSTTIVPGTLPDPVAYKLDAKKLVAIALDKRMEMLEEELRLAEDQSSVALAKNGLLPLVTLGYTYNVPGLGKSWDDSFSMIADKNFEDHRVSLDIQIPIGNEAARAQLRRALAARMQQILTKAQQKLSIEQEVFNAVDTLQANWQNILAARQRVILNARLLDAEVRQFDQQLRTSTDVLDAQTKLATAQSDEIAAITDYQISRVDLAFATGMLLGTSNVAWAPMPAPKR